MRRNVTGSDPNAPSENELQLTLTFIPATVKIMPYIPRCLTWHIQNALS